MQLWRIDPITSLRCDNEKTILAALSFRLRVSAFALPLRHSLEEILQSSQRLQFRKFSSTQDSEGFIGMDKIHITYHTTIVKIVKEILLKNADMESIMWSERGEVSQQGESWKSGRGEL